VNRLGRRKRGKAKKKGFGLGRPKEKEEGKRQRRDGGCAGLVCRLGTKQSPGPRMNEEGRKKEAGFSS